ncbi:class I SAM-dependent methyltransferase [Lentisphaera profundi]|uniref:Class I SAM-dependent methyltransferase n=1 Tax=Lentisphaera profundi TaxID=1658616 RepID=A0ABY7VVQ8_9BACT|nr:class I SAM-dependent methyltransferase [Lentisphaera profundi]WDE96819.1 class I SAM-dependent methyltransferase [Lentisphaera profundi]
MTKQILLLLSLLLTFPVSAEEAINSKKPDVYLGRQIAYTMHSSAANWLTRSNREKEESTEEMIAALDLKAGMVLGDVGCGNGYHALKMAKLVGDQGKVYCVDIQSKMLELLKQRATKNGIKNCVTVLGKYTDPMLPKNSLDLILLVDAYHEFSDPENMLKKMRESLKPEGILVLIEFRKEDKNVPIKEDHKMTKAQVTKEMNANQFKLVRSYDKLPWQHMLFYGKNKPELIR